MAFDQTFKKTNVLHPAGNDSQDNRRQAAQKRAVSTDCRATPLFASVNPSLGIDHADRREVDDMQLQKRLRAKFWEGDGPDGSYNAAVQRPTASVCIQIHSMMDPAGIDYFLAARSLADHQA